MSESTFSKLTTCSELNQVAVEYNDEEYLIKPYSYRDGKQFINDSKGDDVESILLEACVEAFVEEDGTRMAEAQSYEVLKGLIESLPYALVESAGTKMLSSSFGENWKSIFIEEVEEVEAVDNLIEITQEDIDEGREQAQKIANA